MATQLQEAPPPTFLKSRHELTSIIKSLTPAAAEAVKYLVSVLNDEKATPTARIDAAKMLITENRNSITQKNADDMARLIAEIKVGRGANNKQTIEESKKTGPILDFSTIREV